MGDVRPRVPRSHKVLETWLFPGPLDDDHSEETANLPLPINKLFNYINRKSPVLIHTPWVRNIGDCAEEIYYGLLKARRDGKKIVFHENFILEIKN